MALGKLMKYKCESFTFVSHFAALEVATPLISFESLNSFVR